MFFVFFHSFGVLKQIVAVYLETGCKTRTALQPSPRLINHASLDNGADVMTSFVGDIFILVMKQFEGQRFRGEVSRLAEWHHRVRDVLLCNNVHQASRTIPNLFETSSRLMLTSGSGLHFGSRCIAWKARQVYVDPDPKTPAGIRAGEVQAGVNCPGPSEAVKHAPRMAIENPKGSISVCLRGAAEQPWWVGPIL